MVTYNNDVRPDFVTFSYTKQQYEYPNKSVIVLAGMDKSSKVLSSQFDIIYVNEGTEITESSYETLITRLRNGVAPYQQIIVDVNPDNEFHWLNVRASQGAMKHIVTVHSDNPRYYDEVSGDYTQAGLDYIERLNRLTGVRKLRFLDGKWASNEGIVYPDFSIYRHVIDLDDVPEITSHFLSVDFGYSNPFVAQLWGKDGDGRLYMLAEVYFTKRTVRVHSDAIKQMCAKFGADCIAVCDHDAEDRATLEENGIGTIPATKAIRRGIQLVEERLKDTNGKPRIYFVRDSIMEIDTSLSDSALPTGTIQEFSSYAWPSSRANKNESEVPVDAYNHGMDAMRYAVAYADGYGGLFAW